MPNTPLILSFTKEGLLHHPELQGCYLAAPHNVYTANGWNSDALVDYERDITINGESFQGWPLEEIKARIFAIVDNVSMDSPQPPEPSLLARVMVSAVVGQFNVAALTNIVFKQIHVAGQPYYVTEKRKYYVNSAIKEVEVPLPDAPFKAPATQVFAWKTGPSYCTKEIILDYKYVFVLDEMGSQKVMMLKKGEKKLEFIPLEQFVAWNAALKAGNDLPFEVESLLTVYATVQLNQGFTERTQPAVFMHYSNINIVVHFPELLLFRHVLGTIKQSPRNPRAADSGYIPPPQGKNPASHWTPHGQETKDVHGYYGETHAPFYQFSELQVNVSGSFYTCDELRFLDKQINIDAIRRSTNTYEISTRELPILIESGNQRGPILLSDEVSNLQSRLTKLIASKLCLEASIHHKQIIYKQWVEKLTQMQEKIAATVVMDDTKKFKIQARALQIQEFTTDQLLSSYALLFFTSKNQGNTPLNQYLNERVIKASEYAKQQEKEYQMLEALHSCTLICETPQGDKESRHRLFSLTQERILTEPCCLTNHSTAQELIKPFYQILLSLKHCVKEKSKIEAVVPVIFKTSKGDVQYTTLVSFTLYQGSLFKLSEEEGAPINPVIHFKIPQQETNLMSLFLPPTHKFWEGALPKQSWEGHLLKAIAIVFNEKKPVSSSDIQHTIYYYTPNHFQHTFALLDVLTHHLRQTQQSATNNSCRVIQAEVYPYLKCITELATTDLVVLHSIKSEDGILPLIHHEIHHGMTNKFIFQQLNGQIVALRDGIKAQEAYVVELNDKIEDNYRRIHEECTISAQPVEIVQQLYSDTLHSLVLAESEIDRLKQENLCMQQQMKMLHNRFISVKDGLDPRPSAESPVLETIHNPAQVYSTTTNFNQSFVEERMKELEQRFHTMMQARTASDNSDDDYPSASP